MTVAQHGQTMSLARGQVVGVRQNDAVVTLGGGVLHATQDAREEGVGDIRNQRAQDALRLVRSERATLFGRY